MSIKSDQIRLLNDHLRRTFTGGKITMTDGIASLKDETRAKILSAFRTFTAFDKDNNPHGENDFCSFEVDGHKVFAKCDYYDLKCEFGSEDPSDPAQTTRVWTIMLAEEY